MSPAELLLYYWKINHEHLAVTHVSPCSHHEYQMWKLQGLSTTLKGQFNGN